MITFFGIMLLLTLAHGVILDYLVSPCDSKEFGSSAPILVNQEVNGSSQSLFTTSSVYLCYSSKYLKIQFISYNQTNYPNSSTYNSCNDPIYLLDVIENFLGLPANRSSETYCYSEIDISTYNIAYESGIYNPNLNHSGVKNTLYNCSTSGIKHSTKILQNSGSFNSLINPSWITFLSIPWKVVNCPLGCPTNKQNPICFDERLANMPQFNTMYRGNFYRINEITSTAKCSNITCDYVAWKPTFQTSPAFHEPLYFGSFILK
jgi:hypothetical protein